MTLHVGDQDTMSTGFTEALLGMTRTKKRIRAYPNYAQERHGKPSSFHRKLKKS